MLIEHLEGVSELDLCRSTQSGLFKGVVSGLLDKFCVPALHKQGLRISSLGKSPLVQYMNALGFSDWHPDGNTQWKLAFGDVAEAMIVALLQNRGVNVYDQQKEVFFEGVPGHIEGLFTSPVGIGAEEVERGTLFEIKCTSPNFFRTARSGEDLEARGYWTQVSCYMHALGINECRFILMNRESCERKELKLEPSQPLLERAARVIHTFQGINTPMEVWEAHSSSSLEEEKFNTYKLKGSETDLPRLPMDLGYWAYRHCFFELSKEYNDGKHEYVTRKTTREEFENRFGEIQCMEN